MTGPVVTEADERRLEHILDQITRIERYTSGGRSEFDANEMIQDAVLRCLSVIGEAAAALTEPTAESLSPASDFVIEIRRFLTQRWEAVGLTLRRVWR